MSKRHDEKRAEERKTTEATPRDAARARVVRLHEVKLSGAGEWRDAGAVSSVAERSAGVTTIAGASCALVVRGDVASVLESLGLEVAET